MASNVTSNLIDIESPESADSRLQFQDFPVTESSSVAKLDIDSPYSQYQSTSSKEDHTEKLIDGTDSSPFVSLLSLEYYQRLFDVDTDQVVDRIIWAIIPKPGFNYLQHQIGSKPDLYGPFWICITLVFSIAITGNLADYLQKAGSTPNGENHWKYDFHAVSLAAGAIFGYAWMLPFMLWAFMKWQGIQETHVGLTELLCVYGYSLSIYVPLSILWVIQISWLQWLLVLIGAAMSGSVLVTAVWPAFKDHSSVILAGVLGFHLLLATCFMLYFYHVPRDAHLLSNNNFTKHLQETVSILHSNNSVTGNKNSSTV